MTTHQASAPYVRLRKNPGGIRAASPPASTSRWPWQIPRKSPPRSSTATILDDQQLPVLLEIHGCRPREGEWRRLRMNRSRRRRAAPADQQRRCQRREVSSGAEEEIMIRHRPVHPPSFDACRIFVSGSVVPQDSLWRGRARCGLLAESLTRIRQDSHAGS